MGHLEPFFISQQNFPHSPPELVHCKGVSHLVKTERVDKTIRKYQGAAQFKELKTEEYRYWQSRSVQERIDAVSELTQAMYALKGEAQDVPRLQNSCPF